MKSLKQIIKVVTLTILSVKTLSGSAQVKPLNIGDQCPAPLIGYLNKIAGQKSLSNKLDKAILIDFWATYCLPCLVKLPLLDSIQRENIGRLTIMSVTQQRDKPLVMEVWNKIQDNNSLTLVDADTVLSKYFPHNGIPHYIWINPQGIVKVITENIDRSDVQKLIEGSPLNTKPETSKIKVKFSEPLYAGKQITLGDELTYHSMITKFRPDVQTFDGRGNNYINVQNNSILHLYQIAYGKFNLDFLDRNRVVLNGFKTSIDSAEFGVLFKDKSLKWNNNKEKNAFSYELFLPDSTNTDVLFQYMQEDLNRYFGLRGIVGEMGKRNQKVMALISLKDGKYQSFKQNNVISGNYSTVNSLKIMNMPMTFFFAKLQPYLKNIGIPLVNNTGYTGLVNIEINNNLENIEAINSALINYGLKFEEKDQLMDVIIITKTVNH